jgi:hypothetical protein
VDKLIDYIGVYDSILEPKLCQKLIELFETNSNDVIEQTTGFHSQNFLRRKGTEIDLWGCGAFNKIYREVVLDGIFYSLEMYKKQTGDPYDVIHNNSKECKLERFRLRKSGKNDGFFSEHCDIVNYNTSGRLLVVMFYLNTIGLGGETVFTNIDLSVQPKEGRVLIFNPSFLFPHKANKPVSEHKYTLQTYLHYTEGGVYQE